VSKEDNDGNGIKKLMDFSPLFPERVSFLIGCGAFDASAEA